MTDFQPSFEFERRFIVNDPTIVTGAGFETIDQAYLFSMDDYAVRVRMKSRADLGPSGRGERQAYLTGKGPRFGQKREEYDIEVDPLWAEQVINRCGSVISKRRYHVLSDQTWEIDQFLGDLEGLWIAEIEGADDIRSIPRPSWSSREVTADRRFNNENLAVHRLSQVPQEDLQAE